MGRLGGKWTDVCLHVIKFWVEYLTSIFVMVNFFFSEGAFWAWSFSNWILIKEVNQSSKAYGITQMLLSAAPLRFVPTSSVDILLLVNCSRLFSYSSTWNCEFNISAGFASFHICKSGWSWHARDNLGCTSRYYLGENIWWSWKEEPLHWVPPDNATGWYSFSIESIECSK